MAPDVASLELDSLPLKGQPLSLLAFAKTEKQPENVEATTGKTANLPLVCILSPKGFSSSMRGARRKLQVVLVSFGFCFWTATKKSSPQHGRSFSKGRLGSGDQTTWDQETGCMESRFLADSRKRKAETQNATCAKPAM